MRIGSRSSPLGGHDSDGAGFFFYSVVLSRSVSSGRDCEEVIANGDPPIELLQIVEGRSADLVVVAVTGGPKRADLLQWVSLLTAQSAYPVVVIHAPTRPLHSQAEA